MDLDEENSLDWIIALIRQEIILTFSKNPISKYLWIYLHTGIFDVKGTLEAFISFVGQFICQWKTPALSLDLTYAGQLRSFTGGIICSDNEILGYISLRKKKRELRLFRSKCNPRLLCLGHHARQLGTRRWRDERCELIRVQTWVIL